MLTLSSGRVHLWLVRPAELQGDLEQLTSFLSEDERARAASYKLAAPQVQFVLSRGFLRRTLGAYLAVAPESLTFGKIGNEKPILAGNRALHFNLSHTANAIALVIAGDRPVGVDVEQLQTRRSLLAITQMQFHPCEQAEFVQAADADKLAVFYRIWTCKEAYLKGLGYGFAQSLTSFALLQAGERYVPHPRLDDQDWSVISESHGDVALAVAAPGAWSLQLQC